MNGIVVPGLRVRLQFDDDEKYWLFIDLNKVKTIQDVIEDINIKYSIVCDKLLIDDAQLYYRETVGILQEKDLIRVCLKSSKKKKAKQEESVEQSDVPVAELPPKPKKKKKCPENTHAELESHVNLIPQAEPLIEVPVKEKRKKTKQIEEEAPSLCELQSSTTLPPATEIDTSNLEAFEEKEEGTKRKRIRRRRKNHHKSSDANTSLIQNFEPLPPYVPDVPKERIHVRFDDNSTVETEPESFQEEVLTNGNKNSVSYGFDKANPSCIEEVKVKDYKPHSKPVVNQRPSATSSPVNPQLGALLSLRSAVFSRNTNEKPQTPSYNNVPPPSVLVSPNKAVPPSPKTKASKKLDPMAFPLATGPPRVNDIIAFKVLELSDNYNPEISDYMQGRVSQIDLNGDITVDLLDPRVKRHARGKFELLEDEEEIEDEEQEVEYESTVMFNWKEMLEPRLIFP